MKLAAKNFGKLTLVASALFFLSSPTYAAPSNTKSFAPMATKCQLGEVCNAPGIGKLVYFYVTPQDGTNYSCTLSAKKDNEKVFASIESGKSFHFASQQISAGKGGSTVNISGNFDGQDGQIKVRGILNNNDGSITCNKAS